MWVWVNNTEPPEPEVIEEPVSIEEEPEVNEEIPEVNEPEEVKHPEPTNTGPNKEELTPKQSKVLDMVKKGLTTADISKEMGVSPPMISKYKRILGEKGLIE